MHVGFSEFTSLELETLSNQRVCQNEDYGLPENSDCHPNLGFFGHHTLRDSHLISAVAFSSFVPSVTHWVRPIMGTSLLVLSDSTVNLPKQLSTGGSCSDFAKIKSNL